MKFFGTLMFPSNKYMILKFTNKDVICEDILESMVGLLKDQFILKCSPLKLHRVGMRNSRTACTHAGHAMPMQVVFSEAWWVGKKEDNPEEFRLPLPHSVIEAGKKAQGV